MTKRNKTKKECDVCKKSFCKYKLKKVPHTETIACPVCYKRVSNFNFQRLSEELVESGDHWKDLLKTVGRTRFPPQILLLNGEQEVLKYKTC